MIAVDRPELRYREATAGIRCGLAVAGMVALAASGCGSDRAPSESGTAVADYDGELEAVLAPVGEHAEIGVPWIGTVLPSGDLVLATQASTRWLALIPVNGNETVPISRKGGGPGEIGRPVALKRAGGILAVADGTRPAIHLFDSQAQWIRTIRLGTMPGQSFVLLRGDTVVLSQEIPSPERFGLPLHAMADGTEVFASFGSEGRLTGPRDGSQMLRLYHLLAAAPGDSTFWAAPIGQYRLEHWTARGQLISALDIERSWFPPVDWTSFNRHDSRKTAIVDLLVDGDGQVIVLTQRTREAGDGERIDGVDPHSLPPTGMTYNLSRIDHVVEMINPVDGSVLGSLEIKDRVLLTSLLPGGMVFGIRAGADGVEYPIVLQLPEPFRKDSAR